MKTNPIIFSRKSNRVKIELSKALRLGMTHSEFLVWEKLRAHRFHGLHFRRQAVIDPYIVDFYCHTLRLVVEIDGEVHRDQRGMDAEREKFLNGMGLCVVRFSNKRVLENLDEVMRELADICEKQENIFP